jgi:hypothetical protein
MSRYTEALAVIQSNLCHLGKHDGQTWEWIVDHDPSYVRWVLLNIENLDDEIRDALEVMVNP